MKVLDLGCGLPSRNPIKRLKGEAARVVGADIDPAAQSNDEVDEVVIFSGRILPFDSGDFDIVVCDYVMEHIEEPSEFLKEIHRVLRHPGYLFFRTPSKYHYVAMMTRVIPNSWHNNISLRLRGMSNDNHKTYPTFYKFNSKRDIFRHSISSGFSRHCIDIKFIECEPSYLLANRLTFAIGMGYERIVNSTELLSWVRANIFGTIVK